MKCTLFATRLRCFEGSLYERLAESQQSTVAQNWALVSLPPPATSPPRRITAKWHFNYVPRGVLSKKKSMVGHQ